MSRVRRLATVLSGQYRRHVSSGTGHDSRYLGRLTKSTHDLERRRDVDHQEHEVKLHIGSRLESDDRDNDADRSDAYKSRRQYTSHVPFADARDALRSSKVDTSSLSSRERQAFDRLSKIAPVASSAIRREPAEVQLRERREAASALDAILDESILDRHAPIGDIVRRPIDESGDLARPNSDDMAAKELRRITRALDRAKTDMQAWEVFTRDIMAPVIALQLDVLKSTAPPADIVSSAPKPDFDIVGPNLHSLLLHTVRVLHNSFPRSALMLSIVPCLKQAGASAFALGASTELYNHVLEYTLRQNADLAGMLDILDEMEREVITPDGRTLEIVKSALGMVKEVQHGKHGSAIRIVWDSAYNKKIIGGLKVWRDRIVDTQEAAQYSDVDE